MKKNEPNFENYENEDAANNAAAKKIFGTGGPVTEGMADSIKNVVFGGDLGLQGTPGAQKTVSNTSKEVIKNELDKLKN